MIANNRFAPCLCAFGGRYGPRAVLVWAELYGNPSRRGKFPRRIIGAPQVVERRWCVVDSAISTKAVDKFVDFPAIAPLKPLAEGLKSGAIKI
jgi:hypothetical protein